MSYTVLARKWRPQTFDDVVGQEVVTRTLKNALASGRVGQAFLFSGARGVGKTTTARLLAKALNCSAAEGPTPEPCNACVSCREITAGTAIDVQEIDGASNNSVDDVRELRESARYNPARDRFKVWIIDEVHQLSGSAFNALLKTLEEPPPRVKFIFATTESHKLPQTILSRCQQYDFRLIPTRELLLHLRAISDKERIAVSDEALARVARAAEGSVRDALSLFDQVLAFSGDEVRDEDVGALLGLIDRELLVAAAQGVLAGDSLGLLDLVERLADYGADYRNFTRELLLCFRELLLVKIAPGDSALLAGLVPEERERLKPLAEAFSEDDLLRTLDLLARLDGELRQATDARVTLELALLKLAQMRRLMPFAELVARVEALAGGLPPAEPAAGGRARAAAPPRAAAPTAPRAEPRPARREPEPEPEPAPPAPASAGDLRSRLLAAGQGRPSLLQPLRAGLLSLEGGTLRLEVPPDFEAFARLHADDYAGLARQALGRAVKVEVLAGGAAAGAASQAPSPEQQRRESLAQQASQDPVVREALDLFNGKVVGVREVES